MILQPGSLMRLLCRLVVRLHHQHGSPRLFLAQASALSPPPHIQPLVSLWSCVLQVPYYHGSFGAVSASGPGTAPPSCQARLAAPGALASHPDD
jgi:hypothetical protein